MIMMVNSLLNCLKTSLQWNNWKAKKKKKKSIKELTWKILRLSFDCCLLILFQDLFGQVLSFLWEDWHFQLWVFIWQPLYFSPDFNPLLFTWSTAKRNSSCRWKLLPKSDERKSRFVFKDCKPFAVVVWRWSQQPKDVHVSFVYNGIHDNIWFLWCCRRTWPQFYEDCDAKYLVMHQQNFRSNKENTGSRTLLFNP